MSLSLVAPPLVGRHSEAQVITTLSPGDVLVVKLSPPSQEIGVLLTGFQADCEPETVYAIAHWHPEVQPHEGYVTPALVEIVNQNLREVMPLIAQGQTMVFRFENKASYDVDFEVVVGFIIGSYDKLRKFREARLYGVR